MEEKLIENKVKKMLNDLNMRINKWLWILGRKQNRTIRTTI